MMMVTMTLLVVDRIVRFILFIWSFSCRMLPLKSQTGEGSDGRRVSRGPGDVGSCDEKLKHDKPTRHIREDLNEFDAGLFTHVVRNSGDSTRVAPTCSHLALLICSSFEPLSPSQWDVLLSRIFASSRPDGHRTIREALESLRPHLDPGHVNALEDDSLFVLNTSLAESLASADSEDGTSECSRRAHSWLLSCCFGVMRELLHDDMCSLREPGRLMQDISPELVSQHVPPVLRYACRYWISHASHSNKADYSVITAFLKDHFLHWVETMTLIQNYDNAVDAVEACQSFTSRAGSVSFSASGVSSVESWSSRDSSLCRTLEDLLYDARRFLCAHGNIINEAPLQLYYMAAYFTPMMSCLPQMARAQSDYVNKVRLSGTNPERWSLELFTVNATNPNRIVFSPSGRWLACQSFDTHYNTDQRRVSDPNKTATLSIWNTRAGRLTYSQRTHVSRLTWFGFVNDALLAFESSPGIIELMDPKDGSIKGCLGPSKVVEEENGKGREHKEVANVPPVHMGDAIAIASWSGVLVYDVADGKLKHTLKGNYPRFEMLGYTRGRLVVVLAERADIWDPETGNLIDRHDFGFHAIRVWIEEGYLAAASDSTAKLWDLVEGTLVPLPYEKLPRVGVFSASEQYVVFGGIGRGSLCVFDTSTWERTQTDSFDNYTVNTIQCYEHRLIARCSGESVALNGGWNWSVIDLQSGKHRQLSPSAREGHDVISLTSASGLMALSCSTWTKVCSIEQAECIRVVSQIPSESRQQVVTILAGSAWGERVLTAHQDGKVALWELQSGSPRLRCRLDLPPYSIRAQVQLGLPIIRHRSISQSKIALSRDGSVMAISEPHLLSVFELDDDTCRAMFKLQFEEHSLSALSLSQDGRTLATLNASGLVRVWRLRRDDDGKRQPQVVLETSTSPVHSFLALNGDGSLLAVVAQARMEGTGVSVIRTLRESGSPYRIIFRRIGQALDPDPASYVYLSPTQPRWLAISRNHSFVALGLRDPGGAPIDSRYSIRFVHIETGQLVFWTDDTSAMIGLEKPHDLAGLNFDVDETGVEVGGMRFEADTTSRDATKLKPHGTPLPGTWALGIPGQDRKWVMQGSERLLCLPFEHRVGRALTRRYGEYLVAAIDSKLLFVKHDKPSMRP